MMAKYFATSLAIEKGGERTARHQQLLSDFDHLDKLCRVGIEIDHVAGLTRRLRAGLHGDTNVRRASAGASLVPSPAIAISRPVADCCCGEYPQLSSGVA